MDECCVCFDTTTGRTPCGHVLCDVCRLQLVPQLCPLCRAFLLPEEDDQYWTTTSESEDETADYEYDPGPEPEPEPEPESPGEWDPECEEPEWEACFFRLIGEVENAEDDLTSALCSLLGPSATG